MSTNHAYICDGCHGKIGHHEQVKVVSTVDGYYFFHVGKDCQQDWQLREDRKKFDMALEAQQRSEWFRQ